VNRVAGPVKRVSKILSITLALPDPTDEELMYKKGAQRAYNQAMLNTGRGMYCSSMLLLAQQASTDRKPLKPQGMLAT
jgi:hypothetical protein